MHFDKLFEMRWGLVACVLVACGGKGAVLEIHTKADHVEVWVSAGDCSITLNGSSAPCPHSIAWLSAGPMAKVDSSFELLDGFPLTLTVHGGIASLELRAPADRKSLDRIIAVGYDASGAPIEAGRIADGIEIPQSGREVWRLDLVPAEDISVATDPNAPPRSGVTERTHAWPADGGHGCLAWQQHDGTQWTREVIAPEGDHDCDGFPIDTATECDDFWFHDKQTTAAGACVQAGSAGPGSACTVGNLAGTCADGLGGTKTCMQLTGPTLCVPDIVCAQCANPLDPTCAAMEYDSSTIAAPLIACPMDGTSANGSLVPCNASGVLASFMLPFGCTQATLTSRELPPVTVHGPGGTMFADNGMMLTFHVTAGTSTCQIDLTWDSGTPIVRTLQYTLNVYVGVYALVLPVTYQINDVGSGPCDPAQTCSMSLLMGSGTGSGDHIWDCGG